MDDRQRIDETMTGDDVLLRRIGGLGRITLNRPEVGNVLTRAMLQAIGAGLQRWLADADVHVILIDGAGERGLCGGGDVLSFYDAVRSGHHEVPDRHMHDAYRLAAAIARCGKPYVAIMDGLVMGGGVGISAHGSIRIVTERSRFAMPEVAVGFVPDSGGTRLLANGPGELGTHAALTGAVLTPGDIIGCSLADHHVPSDTLPALLQALGRCRTLPELVRCVAGHATPPRPARLEPERGWIDACYGHDSIAAILEALQARPEPAAQAAARAIAGHCPTALAVTLRALREMRRLRELEPCLQLEYRLAVGLMRRPDFVEGVRAAVIDKDRPLWQPEVASEIDTLFRFEPPLQLRLA